MNNLSSYCGLVDAKIRAADKDLPVQKKFSAKELSFYDLSFLSGEYTKNQSIPLIKRLNFWCTNDSKMVDHSKN